jgi:sec-independent protein translocase protein TatB
MFDIGWSELVVIAVVALIAIGPKELPAVLRTVGQWMRKARKMASEFQGQFQEAMREAEMADLKKSFDEVKEAATGFSGGNVMTSLEKDVGDALRIDPLDKPAASSSDTAIQSSANAETDSSATPAKPDIPIPQIFTEADAHAAASQPLAIVQQAQPQTPPQETEPAAPGVARDAKAS